MVRSAVNAAVGAYEVAFFRSTLLAEPAPVLAETRQTVRRVSSILPPKGAAGARQ